MKNEVAIAYCAGFFDGEGMVGIHKASVAKTNQRDQWPTLSLKIQVGQKDRRPLDFLRSMFGGKIYTKYRRGIPVIYEWHVGRREHQKRFLRAILPYVILKKREVEIGIEFLNYTPLHGGRRQRYSDEELSRREHLSNQSRQIKKENSLMFDARGQFEIPMPMMAFYDGPRNKALR